MGSVNPSRPYRSPRRRAQAAATRESVLLAARATFIERGYVMATITAIAARADVSPETVYATFKNKRSLLASVVDVSIVGDDEPVPLLERDWVGSMRDEPEPRRRTSILARNGRMILERITPIYEVIREAAATDPEIDALWQAHKAQRLTGQRALVQIVTDGGTLRAGLDLAAAADVLFAIGSPETYRLLTEDRGWTPIRFERWYADAVDRLLLDGSPRR